MSLELINSVPEKEITSPNGALTAYLRLSERVPWENALATLFLDNLPFGNRRFGLSAIWSPCSRYFAISEWLQEDPAYDPDFQLILVDVARRRECIIDRVTSGFIDPVFIHNGMLKYSIMTHAMKERAVDHRNINSITSWRPVSETVSTG